MAQKDLIPLNKRTKEQQKAICSKGGKASGEARRKKRTIQSIANDILEMTAPVSKATRRELAQKYGVKQDTIDVAFVSTVRLAERALRGDMKAFELLRDSAGQKPIDNLAVHSAVPVVIRDDIPDTEDEE